MKTEAIYKEWNPEGERTVVFLHGFTGTENSLESVIPHLSSEIRVIAPLLPGHGFTKFPIASYDMELQIDWLRQFLETLNLTEAALMGYSMGGRLALGYALRFPVKQLILVSASPGISNAQDRFERVHADGKLAERIEREGLAKFVDYWESIPLFETQRQLPQSVREKIRSERLHHDPVELAKSLREFSTGQMPNYWPQLASYNEEVSLLVGERDAKFVAINEKMEKSIPFAKLFRFEQLGHAIQVENPKMFATIIEDILLRRP